MQIIMVPFTHTSYFLSLLADELDVIGAGMDELELEGAGEAFVEGEGSFEAAGMGLLRVKLGSGTEFLHANG